MSILEDQNLYTHAGDFSNDGGTGDTDSTRARLIDAWKKNLGHNPQVAEENHAAGFSGFTYAPHNLSTVMGGATPNDQRVGPQGQLIQAGGAEDEYGPVGFSRLSNREDVDNGPSRSLLGAFAQMLSSHGGNWNNLGMQNTIAGSTTLRSARNRTHGVNDVPESSGGWQDLYDATTYYRLESWNAADNQEAEEPDSTTSEDAPGGDVLFAEESTSEIANAPTTTEGSGSVGESRFSMYETSSSDQSADDAFGNVSGQRDRHF